MPPKQPSLDRMVYDRQAGSFWTAFATEASLFHAQTPFQRAEIHVNPDFGRLLFLDGELQSASGDEFIYHEALVHPALVAHPEPRRVVVLGGAEGATVREVLCHKTVQRAVMIDLDREVVEASKKHLPEFSAGAFSDPRCEVVIGDARAWLEQTRETFDVIVSDLTEPGPGSPSAGLFSREFFRLVQNRLAKGGVLSLQASRANPGCLDMHARIRETLGSVFRTVRTLVCFIPSYACHWAMAVASDVHDPAALGVDEVDRILLGRGVEGRRYYDGLTHRRLFALPLYVRRALAEPASILRDAAATRASKQ